jgi:hypothetical protein
LINIAVLPIMDIVPPRTGAGDAHELHKLRARRSVAHAQGFRICDVRHFLEFLKCRAC